MSDFVCSCCGGTSFVQHRVIWPALASEWRLSPAEVASIDEQQGLQCASCQSCLRTQALAKAVGNALGFRGPFREFRHSEVAQRVRILEINPSARLTRYLEGLPGHLLVSYPAVDMMALPQADASFDLVIHSDTLEHVEHPVRGLAECHRVLRPGGACFFTVPVVPGRLTSRRDGLPPSFHGEPGQGASVRVVSEYGADVWRQVIEAGFAECGIYAHRYPASLVLIARKY